MRAAVLAIVCCLGCAEKSQTKPEIQPPVTATLTASAPQSEPRRLGLAAPSPPEAPVYLRIQNATPGTLSKLRLGNIEFGRLRAGATSEYRKAEPERRIYRAVLEQEMRATDEKGHNLSSRDTRFLFTDTMGFSVLGAGHYTVAVSLIHDGPRTLGVSIEKD